MTDDKNSYIQRLQKWLSIYGIASRREAEALIRAGRLSINGKVAKLGDQCNPQIDKISLDGKLLTALNQDQPTHVYWLLNKPDKCLTSTSNDQGYQTIYDLPSLKGLKLKVKPVGRLDYRTEGLLLLTNDGALVHKLCHPSHKIPRHYQVMIDSKLPKTMERQIQNGYSLEDGPVKCQLKYAHSATLNRSKGYWYTITVYEGRNRLVRRLFESLGFKVRKLLRIGFGEISLPLDLEPGEYKQLSSKEIKYLKGA